MRIGSKTTKQKDLKNVHFGQKQGLFKAVDKEAIAVRQIGVIKEKPSAL